MTLAAVFMYVPQLYIMLLICLVLFLFVCYITFLLCYIVYKALVSTFLDILVKIVLLDEWHRAYAIAKQLQAVLEKKLCI